MFEAGPSKKDFCPGEVCIWVEELHISTVKVVDCTRSAFDLTYAEDTLAALGGIARTMAELIKRKDPSLDAYYFGGVWEADMHRAILGAQEFLAM